MKRYLDFAFENSLFLIIGAVAGLVWANVGPSSYLAFRDIELFSTSWVPFFSGSSQHSLGLHYLVNDVLMAFFFALAGKEVWSAMLPGGALRGVSRAAVPLICAVGGMAGPAVIYLLGQRSSDSSRRLGGVGPFPVLRTSPSAT